MDKYTLFLYPLGCKKPLEITKLLSWELSSHVESPAVSFHCLLATKESLPECRKIEFLRNQVLLFSGFVDYGEYQIDRQGGRYTLEARSSGGLLLDNQAEPSTYWQANVATVFARHVGKYQFHLGFSGRATLGEYTIHQGISQWQAFYNFVLQSLGVRPYVENNAVLLKGGKSPQRLVFGGSNGYPYTRCVSSFAPYHFISQIILRDGEGNYSSGVTHPLQEKYGIQRVRYVTPWEEHAQSGERNAHVLLKQSREKLYAYELTLPYFSRFSLYDNGEIYLSPTQKKEAVLTGQKTGFSQKGYYSILKFAEE